MSSMKGSGLLEDIGRPTREDGVVNPERKTGKGFKRFEAGEKDRLAARKLLQT